MGRGSSGAGNKAGKVTANNFPSPVTPLKASQLAPITGGSDAQKAEAAQERKRVASQLIDYAMTRMSDGRPISKDRSVDALSKTPQEQLQAAKQRVSDMKWLKDKSLVAQKIKEEADLAKDINSRYKRVSSFITSSTNASFWIGVGSVDLNIGSLKDYIDGKTQKPKLYNI